MVPSTCTWVGESFWKRVPGRQGRKSIQSGGIEAPASVCRESCGTVVTGQGVHREHPTSGHGAGPWRYVKGIGDLERL